MSTGETYYGLLGVQRGASESEIRDSFKKLAVRLHPDKGGDPAVFQKIQTAYDTLSDSERRTRYDRQRKGADTTEGVEVDFAQNFREGNFVDEAAGPAPSKKPTATPTGDSFGGVGLMGQLEKNEEQAARVASTANAAVVEKNYSLTHTEGFDAWMRNNRHANSKAFTGDDLVRQGLISATGSLDQFSG